MSVFSPSPEFRSASAQERMGIALDTPFTLARTIGENFQQGVLDSFGLGSTIRDLAIPQGNTYQPPFTPTGNPLADTIVGGIELARRGIEAFRPDQPSMSADEYKSSPYFREAIPWEPGMTEDRAAALAAFWDLKTVRQHFSAKQPVAMFAGQLLGQALDPINYIPVFGPAASAAMVARFGSVLGRAMVAAGDASLNTAIASLATRGIREQFGDDVSWQSTAMDIAMSAVIGGVFGGVVGTVARGADARARLEEQRAAILSDTARNAQESLIPLNEAIDGIVSRGEVSLSPNGMAPIERVRQEVATRVEGPQALRTETAAVTGDRIGDVVITPAGTRVNVRPEVVDLSTLVQAAGALQVRNRNSAASAAQIEDIALNLDPARLMPAVSADQGAPIVGPDNVVDSGNGRVQAIKRAAEAYPERYAAYRKAIEAAGYSTEGMQTPVLVQRRTTNLSEPARAQFNAEANNSAIARMNAVELANMDRTAMMQPGVLDLHVPGELTSAANRPFVNRFLAEIGQNERAALVDESGTSLSADGVRRVENALVAAAYGDIDPTVIRRFAEATDSNTRTIVGAMSDAAPRWALMRRAVKAGEISPEFDMTTELTDALRLVANWRDQAAREGRAVSTVIREGLGQFDIFKGEIAPEAQVFVRMFYRNDHFGVATGREALAGRFDKIVSSAFDLGQPQLFGDAAPTSRVEVLRNAAEDIEADIFAPDRVEPSAQERGAGGERYPPGAASIGDRQGAGKGAGGGSQPGTAADILSTMERRFTEAGRPPEEARAAATLISEFYGSMATRLGVPVGNLVDQFGLPDVRAGRSDDLGAEARILFQAPRNPVESLGEYRKGDTSSSHFIDIADSLEGRELIAGIEAAESIEAAHKVADDWALARGRESGVEHLAGFDDRGGLMVIGRGTKSFVAFPDYFHSALEAGRVRYATHNHPSNSGFSVADLSMMLLGSSKRDASSGTAVTAVGHKGAISTAEPGPAGRAMMASVKGHSNWAEFLVRTKSAVHDMLQRAVWRKSAETQPDAIEAAMAGEAHLSDIILHRIGVIDLRTNSADIVARLGEKLGVSVDGALDELLKDLQNVARRTGFELSDIRDFGGSEAPGGVARKEGLGPDAAGGPARDTGSAEGGIAPRIRGRKTKADPRQLTLFQSDRGAGARRGAIEFGDDGRAIMSLFERADASTALHETGHFFLRMFERIAIRSDAPDELRSDWEAVRSWWDTNAEAVAADSPAAGVTAADVRAVLANGTSGDAVKDLAIKVGLQEQWARGIEAYLRDGVAPTPGLRGIFEQFKKWLTAIYRQATDLGVNLTPEVRAVFDRLLGAERELDVRPQKMTDAKPPPEPPPEGLDAAAARVGVPDTMRDLADQHGVDLTTGDYAESFDIDQMRAQGRLTPDDDALLKAADQEYDTADAYGQALKAAVACII